MPLPLKNPEPVDPRFSWNRLYDIFTDCYEMWTARPDILKRFGEFFGIAINKAIFEHGGRTAVVLFKDSDGGGNWWVRIFSDLGNKTWFYEKTGSGEVVSDFNVQDIR